MNPTYTFSATMNPENIMTFQPQQHLTHIAGVPPLNTASAHSHTVPGHGAMAGAMAPIPPSTLSGTMSPPNPSPSTSSHDTSASTESSPSSSPSSASSSSSKKRSLLDLDQAPSPSTSSPPSGPSVPNSPAAEGPSTKPPPSKKRKKNGTTHSKLIEEFAQRSHVRNSVNLSSYHGKKQNIKTLCPYHDMLPVIQVMEKEVFNRAKGNSIKKEYCNMLPIIRNHCEWTCSGSPYKLECRNLLMRAKELYEYEFDLNDIAMPFMNAVVLGGPNPNICIQLIPPSQSGSTTPPGQFGITFKPLQNLSLLERNETCNIALKAISCGTFKRNLQPVPDACRITKLLDGDGCFVTVDKGQNTSNGNRGNQSIFFKVSTCEVRQRRKLQGTDSVLGVGFDCASRLSWQKPRIYWMHQSIHTMRDKKSKKIVEKKHISNRDLRFSILVPYDFRGSIVVFMIGIQDDKHYTINTSIPCKRYNNSTGEGGTASGTDASANFNGINGYNPGLQSIQSVHIKNDHMALPSSLSITGEQSLAVEHPQDIPMQGSSMAHFGASNSNNGQSPTTNSTESNNDTLTSNLSGNLSNGCSGTMGPIPPLPNITPSSVSIQPSLSLNNISSTTNSNNGGAVGESQSANASPNTNSKLNLIQSNPISNTTTTTNDNGLNPNGLNSNGLNPNGLNSTTNTTSNGSFPPPPTNTNLTTFSPTTPLFTGGVGGVGNNTMTDFPVNGGKLNLQALNAQNGQFLATDNSLQNGQSQPVPPQGLQAGFSGNSIITASAPLSPYNAVTGPQTQSFLTTLPMNTMSVNGMNPMNAINTMSVNGMGNHNGNLMYSQAPPSVIMSGVNSMNSVNGLNGMGIGGNGLGVGSNGLGVGGIGSNGLNNGTVGPNPVTGVSGAVMDTQDSTQSLIQGVQPPGAISVYSTINNNTTINNTINNMHSMAMANQTRDTLPNGVGVNGGGLGGNKTFGEQHEDKGKFIDQDLENGHKTNIELLRSVNFRDEQYQTLASKWIRTCIERYSQNEDIYHLYLLNIVQSLINSIGDDKTVRGLKRCWMSYNNTENEWSFLHMICSKNLLYLFESMANLLANYKHELMVSMATTPKESKLRISPFYCCVIQRHHQFSKYLMEYFLMTLSSHDLRRILQNGTPNEPSNSMIHHLIGYGHNETLQSLYGKNASQEQEAQFLSPEQVQMIQRHLQINGNGEMDGMQMGFSNAFSK